MDWKELYSNRKQRPGINELRTYFSDEIFTLFTTFADELSNQYNVGCAPAVFSAKHGWSFRFGRNGLYLLKDIYMAEGAFYVNGMAVRTHESLQEAICYVDKCYTQFKANYDDLAAKKSARQSELVKRRMEREKQEVADMANLIIPEKFNRYRWLSKVSRQDLIRLYTADAKGLPDEELADNIGFTFYTRCVQGRDTWQDISAARLQCHHCGNTLHYATGLLQCPCGFQYLFRDYMRSFRRENMPSGSATHIFNTFITSWEKVADYPQKMFLIDSLLHEFHINLTSGVKGRFVGINLIEGSKKQIADLLLSLAYGENKDATLHQFSDTLKE